MARKAGSATTRIAHFYLMGCLNTFPKNARRDVLRWLRFNRELGCLGVLP